MVKDLTNYSIRIDQMLSEISQSTAIGEAIKLLPVCPTSAKDVIAAFGNPAIIDEERAAFSAAHRQQAARPSANVQARVLLAALAALQSFTGDPLPFAVKNDGSSLGICIMPRLCHPPTPEQGDDGTLSHTPQNCFPAARLYPTLREWHKF